MLYILYIYCIYIYSISIYESTNLVISKPRDIRIQPNMNGVQPC